ncbi:MAG TPA: hypothetical protein VF993_14885 [Myxococcales bacterium]
MLRRRELLSALVSLWLARAVEAAEAVRGPLRDELRARLLRLSALSRALAAKEIRPLDWQGGVEELSRGIDLPGLMRAADFDRVAGKLALPDNGAGAEPTRLAGVPRTFGVKIFGLRRGRAIIPHGHRNMVSQHFVLAGELHGRHFERVRDEAEHLLLRPTIDRTFRPGDSSSISGQRDNVHWFVARSERAYTLDAVVDNLDPSRGYRFQIDYVDPDRAERDGDALRVRRLDYGEAMRLYGTA